MITRKATVLLSVLSLVLSSCGGGSGGGAASGTTPSGSTEDELSISGRVSSVFSFIVPSAHADELPVCKSTCNEAISHCATLSVFSNTEQEIELCKTPVNLDGSFSFEIKNKNALKQFMTKISVVNFNNERRELIEYINPDIGSIVTFNVNQETTLVAPIIQEKAQSENPQSLSEENKNQGQLLKRDLMAMCPGIITEDNVQDVIRNYLGELASGRGRFLVVEYRKRIESNLSIEDLSEQIGAFCSLVEGGEIEVPPSPTPTPVPTGTPVIEEESAPSVVSENFTTPIRWERNSNSIVPTGARIRSSAVWSGTEMLIWGGFGPGYVAGGPLPNTGGRYNPTTQIWSSMTTKNAPSGRFVHSTIWTGNEMIVWGGSGEGYSFLNDGGKYNPLTNNWSTISNDNSPSPRYSHSAVWTGTEMVVWGGLGEGGIRLSTGARYNPEANTWTAISNTNAPSGRYYHSAVWTGTEMIIWGGFGEGDRLYLRADGAKYNPKTDSWTAITLENAPLSRYAHSAFWTGTEMIIWGGESYFTSLNDGGKYNPITNSWTAINPLNTPSLREDYSAVWTGTEMIIWGGYHYDTGIFPLQNTGAKYNPVLNIWSPIIDTNPPDARAYSTLVWTGTSLILWSGVGINSYFDDLYRCEY